jgi:DNA-directed RNA polymerase subunit L
MVQVSKINVSEHSYVDDFKKKDEDIKKCLELISEKELLQLLPKKTRYTLRFDLENANSQLANALRRCLEDELPTLCLTFNILHDTDGNPANFINDLRTNDKYIFGKCDNLKKRLEAIPIKQNINPNEWKISLDMQNKTNDLIDITSGDFKVLHKGKEVPVEHLMYPNYILMRLYPQCYIKLNNIRIIEGLGMDNANSFKYINGVYYEIHSKPMTKVGEKFQNKSSLESDYDKFTIGYSTYRNDVDVFSPIKNACQILLDRLGIILSEWDKIKEKDFSDKINVSKNGENWVITIEGETYTLANLLYYYVYKELPSIEFASGGIRHLDKLGAIVIIKNNNYLELFENATKKIIKDLTTIKNSFK